MKRVKRTKAGTTICMENTAMTAHTNDTGTMTLHRRVSITTAKSISRCLIAL